MKSEMASVCRSTVKIEQIPATQLEKAQEEHNKPYLRKQPMVIFKIIKWKRIFAMIWIQT